MEFDFLNEEGSGLGPTLEYYQLMAQELKSPKLKIWRDTFDYELFPSPSQCFVKDQYELQEIFELLGLLVARAIIDNRIFQVNISPVFWKIVMGKPLSRSDVYLLDPQLSNLVFNL
jgi:E3 ubiquitin-protein ligase TRIP12